LEVNALECIVARLYLHFSGLLWFCFSLTIFPLLFCSALCFVCTLDFLKLLQLKGASLPAASSQQPAIISGECATYELAENFLICLRNFAKIAS